MRDHKVEALLKRNNYAWEFRAQVPLTEVDMAEAKANPARLIRSHDGTRVDAYAHAVKRGDDFPAILVLERPGQKLKLLNGYNRSLAHIKGGRPKLDMMVVRETQDQRVHMLVTTTNNLEGVRPSDDERVLLAVQTLELYPHLTQGKVAELHELPLAALSHYLRRLKLTRRAEQLGVGPQLKRMPKTQQLELAVIKNDNVLRPMVLLIDKHHALNGARLTSFINLVARTSTEQQALTVVTQETAALEAELVQRRQKPNSTPRQSYANLVREIQRLAGHQGKLDAAHLDGLPGPEITPVREAIQRAFSVIAEADAVLQKAAANYEKEMEWRDLVDGKPNSGTVYQPSMNP